MNKMGILQSIEQRSGRSLETEQLKLFLLLVAGCNCAGVGRITRRCLSAAMGEEFISVGLRPACQGLTASGLVEFYGSIPGEAKREFCIAYRIRDWS